MIANWSGRKGLHQEMSVLVSSFGGATGLGYILLALGCSESLLLWPIRAAITLRAAPVTLLVSALSAFLQKSGLPKRAIS